MSLMNSAFCWLLIRHILTYGLVATNFGSQVSILIWFWTDWVYMRLVRLLGHKMGETYWGLNTRSEDYFLSFPTPTHHMILMTITMVTVIQRQHSCGVLADRRKSDSSTVLKLGFDFKIDKNYDF
jgi:hypothetical protein